MKKISTRLNASVIFRSASILSGKDKQKLIAVVVVQIFLGALDLIGVGLIGVIGSLAVSGVGSKEPGDRVQWMLNLLHLDGFSLQNQTAILGVISVAVMVIKTLLSMYFIRKSLFFLSFRAAKLSAVLISRLLAQPLLVVQKRSVQETTYALTSGVDSITVGVLGTCVSLISDSSLLIVMAIGLFIVDPALAASTFLLFALIALSLYRILQVRAKQLGESNVQASIDSNELILQVLSSYRELTVKNRRSYYSHKIGELRYTLAKATAELSFMPNISKYVIEITVIVGCLIVSALQFLTEDAGHAVATLSVFFAASTRIAPAVLRVQQSSLRIKSNTASANSTLELIETLGIQDPEVSNDRYIDFSHSGFKSEINVRKVSLKYPGKPTNAVSDVNLTIKEGEIVALVGSSGAGKTTLVDIILGVLDPDEGEVSISGEKPLEAIARWPGAIAYMPQDVLISNGTIRENIMLGFDANSAPESRVHDAVKIAQLAEFVSELPLGLDQPLGDRGARVSGGQRQRIGIARAIFTAPRLLVLDEATSALDGETEANVSKAIQSFKGAVTVIMIAHRLSTVLSADRVIYMQAGRVLAQGNFKEVREQVPDFDRQAQLMGL